MLRFAGLALAAVAIAIRRDVEIPDWGPLKARWKQLGGAHLSDVVETYKAQTPPPRGDFRKTLRYGRKLRKLTSSLLGWSVIRAVEQGSFTVLWLPDDKAGVLYTVGMGPCIGIAIRTASNGGWAVALAHADSSTDVAEAIRAMTAAVKVLSPDQVMNMSLTLMGGRVSAEGQIKKQFASILEGNLLSEFQEKSEMCTLLGPSAAGMVTGGLVSTSSLSLLNSTGVPVACAEELMQQLNVPDTSTNDILGLGGRVSTHPLPRFQ
ncbi:unnamed protein product [Symbiodinium natans]|uniref:Uncharacterized protein n=1 Tax=Symbiodinium natans TaxID=878477 RepID=A0A812Q5A6_9DINO|nr:unnamed protein product [Symbiodinium natans]